MNIFTREMKANTKALIIWCISMIALIGGGMGKFSAFSSTGQSINDMIEIYPKSLLNILGIRSFDLSTAIGFYGVLYLYLIVSTTVHAVMLGATIIAKEEKDKTAEFLFVKPVSRSRIITLKLLAAFLNIVILNMVTFIASFFIVSYFNESQPILEEMILLMIGMFMLQLIFLCIGSLLAAISKNPKTVASTATAILLITFMLSMFLNMYDKIENLKYLTPFKYFEAESVLLGKGIDLSFVLLSVGIIGVSLAGTYWFYRRKDLHV